MAIKLRQPYLRHALTLANAGMHVEPINIQDPIVNFYIRMYAKNGGTDNRRNPIKYVLDRVDMVDGSDVLFSLDAEEILALDFYHYKESIELGMDERPDMWQYTDFNIPLGLGRVDPVVGFDPTRFANPQLVLYWDLENITDVGPRGYVDGSLRVDIMADVIDEAPARPTGYLMTKQLFEWQTTAAAQQRIELPVDYPYRTLFLRAHKHCYKPYNRAEYQAAEDAADGCIDKVRHDCDEQKYIPFELYADDWMVWDKKWYGFWHQGYWFFVSASSTAWRDLNFRANLSVAGSPIASAAATTAIFPSACQECSIVTGAGSDMGVHVKADGTLPCSTFAWPYGDPDEPEEYLDIKAHRTSRLTVDQAVTGATAQVFLTQHRTY